MKVVEKKELTESYRFPRIKLARNLMKSIEPQKYNLLNESSQAKYCHFPSSKKYLGRNKRINKFSFNTISISQDLSLRSLSNTLQIKIGSKKVKNMLRKNINKETKYNIDTNSLKKCIAISTERRLQEMQELHNNLMKELKRLSSLSGDLNLSFSYLLSNT